VATDVRWVIVALGLVALLVAVAAGVLISVLKSRYDGRFRGMAEDPKPDLIEDLELGERATLVQFSSAFCAPCRSTHRILSDVAGMVDGVRHVEIDAESHLELVRRLDIRRTPTVLVLDAGGDLVTRASGQPRKADVIAAIGRAVDHHTELSR
jgi:thiol-disulfide isomerase/thioredoxin